MTSPISNRLNHQFYQEPFHPQAVFQEAPLEASQEALQNEEGVGEKKHPPFLSLNQSVANLFIRAAVAGTFKELCQWTVIGYQEVIKALTDLGAKKEALDIAKEMLKTLQEVLAEEIKRGPICYEGFVKQVTRFRAEGWDKWITVSYQEVIKACMQFGLKEEALATAKEMLKTRQESLGEKNEWTLVSYQEVVKAFAALGRKEEALATIQQMLKTQEEGLKEKSRWILPTYHDVIQSLVMLELKEEAVEMVKEMFKVDRPLINGQTRMEALEDYKSVIDEIIKAFNKIKIPTEVLESEKKMIERLKKNDEEISILLDLETYHTPEEKLNRAKALLHFQKAKLGEKSEDTSARYQEVIQLLHQLDKHEEALEVAREMLKTRKAVLEEKDKWVAISYQEVVQALRAVGKYEEALEIAKEMLRTRKDILEQIRQLMDMIAS